MKRLAGTCAIVAACTAPIHAQARMEIRASVSGYNLLEPSSRCCPFELHVTGPRLSVTVKFPEGPRTTTVSLSPADLAELRKTIMETEFFSLPREIGERPIDGDEHRIFVRIGARSRQVVLFEWPADWDTVKQKPPLATGDNTRRAHTVWKSIRALVRDPRVNVS